MITVMSIRRVSLTGLKEFTFVSVQVKKKKKRRIKSDTEVRGTDLRLNLQTKTLDWVLSESSPGLTLGLLESEADTC